MRSLLLSLALVTCGLLAAPAIASAQYPCYGGGGGYYGGRSYRPVYTQNYYSPYRTTFRQPYYGGGYYRPQYRGYSGFNNSYYRGGRNYIGGRVGGVGVGFGSGIRYGW